MTKPLPEHLIGQRVDVIETPALVIDLDAMERNIQRMADFARKHQVRWRPHAKAHKCAALAEQLQKAGAHGACVQTLAEAEVLAAQGIRDLFITNQLLAPAKLLRAARLSAQLNAVGGRLALAVDHEEGIVRLSEAMNYAGNADGIDVFVEIDVGQGRCGAAPGREAAELAHAVVRHQRLRFAGLHAYHGRAQHARHAAERRAAIAEAVQRARETRDLIEVSGLKVPLITGSGTGTLVHEAASGVFGELQPGSFLFMDMDYARNEHDAAQPAFEHALFVKTQVISRRPKLATHAVCDAGHKAHAIDSGLPQVWGLPPGMALHYTNGGDEHGILTGPRLPDLGQMLWLVPGHCDPTVNLHDAMVGVRGGLHAGVVERIYRIDARGALA